MRRREPEVTTGVLPLRLARFSLEEWVDREADVPAYWPDGEGSLWRVFRARRRFMEARREALGALGIDWREYNRLHGWGYR